MKYIKEYNTFENDMVSEKITWKNLLVALGLLYAAKDIKQNVELHNRLSGMYQEINSTKSDPRGKDLVKIEEIRGYLINRVMTTDQFKRFDRKWVADSLRSIHFKILDNMENFQEDGSVNRACYIYLPKIKQTFPTHSRFLDEPGIQNVIIMGRSNLYKDDCSEVVTHELYHYLDKLLGDGDVYLSNRLNIDSFIDKKFMKDKEYSLRKFAAMNGMSLKKITPEMSRALDEYISKDFYDYISLPSEVFARWKTFKSKLLDRGYIKDINQTIKLEDIGAYFEKEEDTEDDLDLILILDLDKLEEIDKALN